jgi:hypothetical protein
LRSFVAGNILAQQLQIPADHLEQIIKIVRHSAGEFAHGVHLLRLPQNLLDLRALRRLRAQLLVRRHQLLGARGNDAFKGLVELDLALLAFAQCRLGARSHRDLPLSGLVQPGIVDGDRRLRCDAGKQPLRTRGEHARLRRPKEQRT